MTKEKRNLIALGIGGIIAGIGAFLFMKNQPAASQQYEGGALDGGGFAGGGSTVTYDGTGNTVSYDGKGNTNLPILDEVTKAVLSFGGGNSDEMADRVSNPALSATANSDLENFLSGYYVDKDSLNALYNSNLWSTDAEYYFNPYGTGFLTNFGGSNAGDFNRTLYTGNGARIVRNGNIVTATKLDTGESMSFDARTQAKLSSTGGTSSGSSSGGGSYTLKSMQKSGTSSTGIYQDASGKEYVYGGASKGLIERKTTTYTVKTPTGESKTVTRDNTVHTRPH